jgi:opacity protein-like surface antigen
MRHNEEAFGGDQMMVRHLLLVSAAAGALAIGVTGAQAAGPVSDLTFAAPYVEFGGGLNSTSLSLTDLQSNFINADPSITSSGGVGTGSTIYGAVGSEIMPGLRAELQASYRNNSGAHFNISSEGAGVVGVDTATFMMLANLWKDFDLSDGFSFHIGGGLGFGSKTLTVTPTTPTGFLATSQTVYGVAGLVGVGTTYALANGMKFTADYSVSDVFGSFARTTIPTDFDGEVLTGQFTKSPNQSFTVGLRIPVGGP